MASCEFPFADVSIDVPDHVFVGIYFDDECPNIVSLTESDGNLCIQKLEKARTNDMDGMVDAIQHHLLVLRKDHPNATINVAIENTIGFMARAVKRNVDNHPLLASNTVFAGNSPRGDVGFRVSGELWKTLVDHAMPMMENMTTNTSHCLKMFQDELDSFWIHEIPPMFGRTCFRCNRECPFVKAFLLAVAGLAITKA